MDAHTSMLAALVLFGAAALGGLLMAVIRFSGKPLPPSWLALLHGLGAGAGLTLLIYAAATVGIPRQAQLALGLLVTAAAGGLAMNLLFHQKAQPLPKPMVIGHGLLAVAGFALLLLVVLAEGGL
ncbi:MAG TPA: hypothetical protein VLI06_15760 [Solimonas sp.]|nr:hypothetical protein [Solimonas sp.]